MSVCDCPTHLLIEFFVPFRRYLQTSWLWMLYTILLSCHTVRGAWGKLQPCEVETGQTNIIMDMEESRGNCK